MIAFVSVVGIVSRVAKNMLLASSNPLHNMKLWQKLAILVFVPPLILVIAIYQIKNAQSELNAAYIAKSESDDAVTIIYQCSKTAIDAIRECIYFETTGRNPKHKLRFEKKYQQISLLKSKMKRNRSVSTATLDGFLEQLSSEVQRVSESSSDSYVDANKVAAVMRFSGLTRKLTDITDVMLDEQTKIVRETNSAVKKKRADFENALIFSGSTSLLMVIALAMLFNREILQQVSLLIDNTSRFARGDQLLPQMKGTNEFAQIDEVFHAMVASINALTEREKSVFRNATDLIFVVDENYRLTFANDASMTMIGEAPEDLLQLPVVELNAELREQLDLSKSHENYTFETKLKGPKGVSIEVEVSVHWSNSDRNFYCVAHDIGARKELERMKQSFLAMVTHDLRSPIAANQVALELLLTEPNMATLTPEGERLIRRILSSDHRLMRMINDLLDMEKLNAGLLSLDIELVSFNDLIEETMTSVEPLVGAKSIEIEKDDVDTLIMCDSSRMVQVIVNIVSNAVKVSKSGQKIELRFSEDDSTSIISIQDHGPGIPEDFLPHLFDQYTQTGDKAVAKQGSGLGLAISKKLVDLHTGDIVVTTEMGVGTTFEIHLPKQGASKMSV